MRWLYILLLVLSIAVPLSLSFDKKLRFYTRWKFIWPAMGIIAFFFIVADIFFTRTGIWGFNPDYLSGIRLLGLPVEEWLFFLIIPYASIFLHETLVLYFPQIRLGKTVTQVLTIFLILGSILITVYRADKAYTLYSYGLLTLSLIWSLSDRSGIVRSFFLTFLVILIPFIAVNGILTGSLIENEVVWYNPEEILGVRVITIPLEDFGYGFSLILFNLLLADKLKTFFTRNKKTAG